MIWFVLAMAQDMDGDGVLDTDDSCPSIANPAQSFGLGPPQRLPPSSYDGVQEVTAGDLDGDGDLDLVTAPITDYPDAEVAVYLQRPDGGFDHRPGILRSVVHGVRLADLDGDGALDVLTAPSTMMLNDGHGSFGAGIPIGLTSLREASDALALDLDADGDLDVVTAGYVYVYYGPDTTELYWKENLGGAVFAERVELVSRNGRGKPKLEPADVDGDGDDDLVFADPVRGELGWYELENAAVIDTHLSYLLGTPERAAPADLDGDGDMDVAAVGSDDGRVVWLEQQAGGIWVDHLIDDSLLRPTDVQVSDLNADGVLDLLVAAEDGTRGYFGPDFVAQVLDTGLAGKALAADIDHNGTPDLVVGYGTEDALWFLPATQPADRDADGTCDADDPCPLEPSSPCVDPDGDGLSDANEAALGTDPLLADTDSDGISDLEEALGNTEPTVADTDGDGVVDGSDPCPLGDDPDGDCVCGDVDTCPDVADPLQIDTDGDGIGDVCDLCVGHAGPVDGYQVLDPIPLGEGGYILPVDTDGDGDLDLLRTYDYDGDTVLTENLGNAGFAPPVVLGGGAQHVHAADIDGDGDADLVLSRRIRDEVVVLENVGGNSFVPAWSWEGAGGPSFATTADIDGDGDADLLVTLDDAERVSWLPYDGGLAFGEPKRVRNGGQVDVPDRIATADLDDDGDIDIVTGGWQASGVHVIENLGDGTFGQITRVATNWAENVALGDLDGDGQLDLVLTNAPLDEVQWLRGEAGVGFGPRTPIAELFYGASGLDLADVDLDGDLDVVASGSFHDEMWWFENDGVAGFTGHRFAKNQGTHHDVLHLVDLDDDGVLDVVASYRDGSEWFPGFGTPADFDCEPPPAASEGTCAPETTDTSDTGSPATTATSDTSTSGTPSGDPAAARGSTEGPEGCGCLHDASSAWPAYLSRRRP